MIRKCISRFLCNKTNLGKMSTDDVSKCASSDFDTSLNGVQFMLTELKKLTDTAGWSVRDWSMKDIMMFMITIERAGRMMK